MRDDLIRFPWTLDPKELRETERNMGGRERWEGEKDETRLCFLGEKFF